MSMRMFMCDEKSFTLKFSHICTGQGRGRDVSQSRRSLSILKLQAKPPTPGNLFATD